jgi:hypothetical protein
MKVINQMAARLFLSIRIGLVIFGCAAIWWGVVGVQFFWGDSVPERIADRIIAGDLFKDEVLFNQLPIAKAIETTPYCRPAALRSAALIRLRIAEVSTSAVQSDHENKWTLARSAIRTSLICSPSDPFLWLCLFWVEERFTSRVSNLEYLRISYRLGPNEGWIALKRNWLAFENFGRLTPDLAEAAGDEFVGLVKSGFLERAAEILHGPAQPVRNQLLSRLKDIDERQRRYFEYLLNKN